MEELREKLGPLVDLRGQIDTESYPLPEEQYLYFHPELLRGRLPFSCSCVLLAGLFSFFLPFFV
jgi:hypothetical protein